MLQVVALGGLGEFGLNCLCVEHGDDRVLIDCGVMFAGPEAPGADLVLPDLTYLRERPERLRAVVLTHGHEDHLGALPFLLAELPVPVPVYGTPYTLALARDRLAEAKVSADLRLLEEGAGGEARLSEAFRVEALRVCHSTADAVGLALRTPAGVLVHTGDFKLDDAPLDGRTTDLGRLAALGDEGVLALFSDSTNSETDAASGSEASVERELSHHLSRAKGRVIVSLFASHIPRLSTLFALARAHGRKVALHGRSLLRNVELARGLGRLDGETVLMGSENLSRFAPSELLLVVTGSQAEPRSALVQMAMNERDPTIWPGDTVVLSGRAIPGHERSVGALIDRLIDRGAQVVYPKVAPDVHVSGHASAPELVRVLEAVRPRYAVPIHGELRQLARHADLVRRRGLDGTTALLCRDGDALSFEGQEVARARAPHGRVYLDRQTRTVLSPELLRERARLAQAGLVVVTVLIGRAGQGLLEEPLVTGEALSEPEREALPRVATSARDALGALSLGLLSDDALVREEVVAAARSAYKRAGLMRPTVVPVIIRR